MTGERASSLIVTLLILIFLSILGMNLITMALSRDSYSRLRLDRLKAKYLAEAGIAKAVWELRYNLDPDGNGVGNIARQRLGDGYFQVKHNFQTSIITAEGQVNKAQRLVQIRYNAI